MNFDYTVHTVSSAPHSAGKRSLPTRSRWSRAWLLLSSLVLPTLAAANTLQDISYSALPGDRVQVTLTLAEPAPTPLSFTIDNPARIALDLPDTNNVWPARRVTSASVWRAASTPSKHAVAPVW